MAKIAILGFGTVGSGVYEVLCRNAAGVSRRAGEPVEVKYILDPKDFSGHPAANLFVKSIDTILQDPEVRVVVETIGGTRFAYPYVKACLESGRSVCTSNKEMVATYGAELLGLAKAHDCAFLFEASVGGGTPIITPMHQCLAANVISEVEGIVNGTTNFMLTKMVRENLGFDDALKIAQELGYAETKDPSDDVDEGGNVIDNEPITENLSNLLIKLRNQSENGSTMNVDDYVIRVTVKVVKGDQSYSYTRKYKHTGIYSYYYTLDDNVTRYSFSGAEGDTALKLTNMATREERTITKNDASTLYLRYSMDTDSACIFTRINGNDE